MWLFNPRSRLYWPCLEFVPPMFTRHLVFRIILPPCSKFFFWKNTLARRGRMAAKRGSIPPIPPTWVRIFAQTPWKCHFPLSVVPFFRALTFTSCFKSQFHLHWPLHSGRVCQFSLLLLTVLPARPSVLPSRLDLKREIVGAWGLAGRTDKATMWCEVPVSCS